MDVGKLAAIFATFNISCTKLDNDTLVRPALLCWLSRRYDKAGVEAAAGCEAGREWMLV